MRTFHPWSSVWTLATLLAPVAWAATPATHLGSEATVRLYFSLDGPSLVSVSILDIQGRVVRNDRFQGAAAGPQSWTWDGTGDTGERVKSGVYFGRIATKTVRRSIKIHLLK